MPSGGKKRDILCCKIVNFSTCTYRMKETRTSRVRNHCLQIEFNIPKNILIDLEKKLFFVFVFFFYEHYIFRTWATVSFQKVSVLCGSQQFPHFATFYRPFSGMLIPDFSCLSNPKYNLWGPVLYTSEKLKTFSLLN